MSADGDDELWEEEPSGLSECLETIYGSQASSEAQSPLDSQDAVIQSEKGAAGEPAADPILEADRIMRSDCVIHVRLEEIDPNPEIQKLLRILDERFFECSLQKHGVKVKWSEHMTLSAGLCQYFPTSKQCVIKISIPLLQKATRKDLVQTLLHEMIHAHLFVTEQDTDHEEHGPVFNNHMARINTLGGCYVSLRHTFDVKSLQVHVWKCNGRCAKQPPHFGTVRRAKDRAPGPQDHWFEKHQTTCKGTFVKIAGPEIRAATPEKRKPLVRGKKAKASAKEAPPGSRVITDYFLRVKKPSPSQGSTGKSKVMHKDENTMKKAAKDGEVIQLD